ncbi:MAG TPA: hypothetical protein VD772_12150, partial [Anseongella sp.]|nr:hypothetical protein [Anseongella sp.]
MLFDAESGGEGGINSGACDDLFGMELKYAGGIELDGPAQYNGNIAEAVWNTRRMLKVRAYGYTYDKLNRLTDAAYRAYNGN